jgi:hypothetical protein
MTQPDCKYESRTFEAIIADDAPAELLNHWNQCASCSNLRLIVGYLSELSDEIDQHPAPSAGLIWWKAQLEAKRQLAARSVSSIAVFQKIAIATTVLLSVILISFFAPRVVLTAQPSLLIAGSVFALLLVLAIATLCLWARRDDSPVDRSRGHSHSMI